MSELLAGLVASPWGLLVLLMACQLDGFFPPVPSEALLITVASLAVSGQGPALWLVLPAAALGAWFGDITSYLIGWRMRRHASAGRRPASARRLQLLDTTRDLLARRGGRLILTARFVPVGRVVVTMVAGNTWFPLRRFLGLTALSATLWALLTTAIGAGAGAALGDKPLVAAGLGVVVGLGVGYAADLVSRSRTRRRVAQA